MSKAIEDVLGFAPLTAALRATASGIPNPLPAEFFAVAEANRILGDRAQYIRIDGERRTSKRVQYGAPGRRRNLRDVGKQGVRCLHTNENFPIDMVMLQKLQSMDKYAQDGGLDWLAHQFKEAAQRQQNTRILSVASMLAGGAMYWDADGNQLPTSTGADSDLTIDAGVPANHKNQIGGIIDTAWTNASADIPGHLRAVRAFSARETGLMPTTALYGMNLPRYIQQNTFCQALLIRNARVNDYITNTGEIPDGLFNIKRWIPVYESFVEKEDGTKVKVWDDDALTLLPDVDQPDRMTWWSHYEGSFPVPRTLDVQRDPMSAIKAFEIVYGMFAYATITTNVPGIDVYHGDTFLPMIRNEKAPFFLDVAF